MADKRESFTVRIDPELFKLGNIIIEHLNLVKNDVICQCFETWIIGQMSAIIQKPYSGDVNELESAIDDFLKFKETRVEQEIKTIEDIRNYKTSVVKIKTDRQNEEIEKREHELSQAHKIRERIDVLRSFEGETSMSELRGIVLTPDYQNHITSEDIRLIGDACINEINPVDRPANRFYRVYNKLVDLFASKNIDPDKLKEDFAKALILVSYYDIINGRVEYQMNREKGASKC